MKKKILVVIQDISKAQEHEWFVEYLNRDLFELTFVLINGRNSHMEQFLNGKQIPVLHLSYKKKTDLIALFFSIFNLLLRKRFHIIHTHLFEASLVGLTAAYFARVRVRLYTRHYSDLHHVWFPDAVKYDNFLNRISTGVIAISKNVVQILSEKEHVPLSKIHLVHHGIDMSDYQPGAVSEARQNIIKEKYQLKNFYPVIGAISRFTEWKGLQFLIPAFKNLLKDYPDAVLVLANTSGDYKNEIMALLSQLKESSYRLIRFENDVAALYTSFDCFVHIPINMTAEAFGQTYLEALASGIPSVFTLSGVAPEFIIDRKNALVVPYCETRPVEEAIRYILYQKQAVAIMTRNGYEDVKNNFDIHLKIKKLEAIYLNK